jgi:hypothetical protein
MNPKDLNAGIPLIIGIAFIVLANVLGQSSALGELSYTGALVFFLIAIVTFIQHRMKKKTPTSDHEHPEK